MTCLSRSIWKLQLKGIDERRGVRRDRQADDAGGDDVEVAGDDGAGGDDAEVAGDDGRIAGPIMDIDVIDKHISRVRLNEVGSLTEEAPLYI